MLQAVVPLGLCAVGMPHGVAPPVLTFASALIVVTLASRTSSKACRIGQVPLPRNVVQVVPWWCPAGAFVTPSSAVRPVQVRPYAGLGTTCLVRPSRALMA